MPAASWPRCWSACRPSAVMAAASGWPKMPNTPHSSRSRSASGSNSAPAVCTRSCGLCCIAIAFRARGLAAPTAGRGRLSGGSWSSGFGRFNRFKMVFSGSSGNMDISHCPVLCSTTCDLAPRTHSGWLRSGTSQAKNRKATTTMISPRPSPNRKPSVRSSAPTRLSRIMSEMRTVMIETISSVSRNTPPMVTPVATMSLLKYALRDRQHARIGIERDQRRRCPRRRSTGSRA